ncbi:MAG: orotate phosphoribosyltransferase [Chloroflexi bacterium]|nr:orotate phosphoribosyltransferase [Chloroflexota bacterium]
MSSTDSRATVATLLLDIGAVSLRIQPPFRYRSGLWSPIYTDNRLLCSYPAAREQITAHFVQALQECNLTPDVIAGVATAGIPHAAWLAQALNLPMVYVRAETKDHGKGHRIEGTLTPKGLTSRRPPDVLVVEDLVTTGGGSLGTVAAIREEGGAVSNCVAICTYDLPEAHHAFAEAAVMLTPLCSFEDLVTAAGQRGALSHQDLEPARQWQADPVAWSARYEEELRGGATHTHP